MLDLSRASDIMGCNMVIPLDVTRYFQHLEPRFPSFANDVPFTEPTLAACRDTHTLIAVPSLSIVELRDALFTGSRDLLLLESWFLKGAAAVAYDKGQPGWHLVRRTPVPDSCGRTWYEQQALLLAEEEVPAVRVLVYAMIVHYFATGERLFQDVHVRCADTLPPVGRALVGHFGSYGVTIHSDLDDYSNECIGLASERKPE